MVKQNPFSLYDFLGYFIPGATLVYLVIIFSKVKEFEGVYSFEFLFSQGDVRIESFLFFTIISYSIGHLNNFLSSITVEKYANWIYDYPSKYLLQIQKDFSFKTITVKRILIFLVIIPVSILDMLFGQLFSFKNFYVQRLDDFLIHSIKSKSTKIINQLIPKDETESVPEEINQYDFFRILHHYAYEHTKSHKSKMTNYVVLYGFLRSITLICVLIFWFLLYLIAFKVNPAINYIHLIVVSIVAYIFFMAFMKFYRRYTLETFMIIAISEITFSENE